MLAASIIVFFVLLLIGVPVTHVVLGAAATGILGSGAGPSILVQQSVLGINSYTTLAVPFFIIAGDLASKGKTSEKIVNVINAFLGRIPGGLGIATIVACAFFGAITGSSMATVVAIGSIMLPKLTEAGYPRLLSIGIVTCAGTLGVMIPPSIPMLLIAIALRTSVGAQFTAGILPGLLTAAAMSAYVFFYAKKHKLPLAEKVPFKQKLRVVKESLFALLFPVIVLGSIYSGIATPTESAVISVLYILVIELFVYREIRPRQLHAMFGASAVSAATMTVMMATAQAFVWYMTTAQVPQMLLDAVSNVISSPMTFILVMCAVFFVVGCFTNVATVVVILGPILLPLLQYYGINAYQFCIVAVMMSQIGFITPPFGLCLFVSMKQSNATMLEVVRGAVPFILIMLAVTVVLIIYPQISTCLPEFIFGTI